MEWHFADMAEAKREGRTFDCSTCKPEIQKARKCSEDNWDHAPGGVFPIFLERGMGEGHSFCPAKLFRDDPEFVADLRHLYLAWKTGQVPDGSSLDTMPEEQADVWVLLIRLWEDLTRAEDFKRLGRMLGGDPKKKGEP